MQAFPLQSNFVGFDESNVPIFDRAVDSVFFWDMWKLFFNSGVFANPSTNFQVYPGSGMTVIVKPGAAFINGVTAIETDQKVLTITPSSGKSDRTDKIVLRLDNVNRVVETAVKLGPTTLTRNSNVWELCLADVLVRKGVTSISAADILDTRLNSSVCGVVTSTVNQVSTSTLYNQYASYLTQKQSEWNSVQQQEQTAWQAQTDKQQQDFNGLVMNYNNWFTTAKTNLPVYAGFDMDNKGLYPGTITSTVFNANGSITETMRVGASGPVIATRNTVFNANGTITVTTSVYNDSGTLLWTRSGVTTFEANENIKEEVGL